MEHTIICLEEQQDEFDFKYQTHKLEGKQMKTIWLCLHALMSVRVSNKSKTDLNQSYMYSFVLVFVMWKFSSHHGNFYAAVVDEARKNEQIRALQLLVNKLNDCRKVWSQ